MATLTNDLSSVNLPRHLEFKFWGNISEFPDLPGIYSMWEHPAPYCLNYIGQTINFAKRMYQHRRNSCWTTASIVRFIPISDPDIRTAMERWLVSYHCPGLNTQLYLNSGNKLGHINRTIPFVLRGWDGRKWGHWRWYSHQRMLRLEIPKKQNKNRHFYAVQIAGRKSLNDLDFDMRNMAGMGMSKHLPTFREAATIIISHQNRGRARVERY